MQQKIVTDEQTANLPSLTIAFQWKHGDKVVDDNRTSDIFSDPTRQAIHITKK